jgi:hypothetical protein
MLDLIRAGVLQQLSAGAKIPTDWLAISNMVNWEAVTNMSQPGIPATERYTPLKDPVPFTHALTTGSVFLVRSKPQSWPGLPFGRWVLVGSTNRVSRVWIPENALMPNIRSQVTN